MTKKKGEKAGTLLSTTRGFTAVIFPVHIPAPLYWGVRLRSEHLPSPGFLPFPSCTPGPLEVPLFVQSCAQNIAAAGQPRQSLQRGDKKKREDVTLSRPMHLDSLERLTRCMLLSSDEGVGKEGRGGDWHSLSGTREN